jgi:hypothetical protein
LTCSNARQRGRFEEQLRSHLVPLAPAVALNRTWTLWPAHSATWTACTPEFGTGIGLFDHVDPDRPALNQVRTAASTRVTHLTYTVGKR